MGYEAYVLLESERERLAEIFPPKYSRWIGHHVTHRFGVPRVEIYPYGHYVEPIGHLIGVSVFGYTADDGIEILICTVDGTSKRPDGRTYHITWSLDPEKDWKPVDSNAVIAEKGTQVPHWPTIPIGTTFEYIA